jgi:phosphoglycolate phosphatase
MTYSHILWDFNGTILNDVETGIQSANVLLSRRNMKTMDSVESYHDVFCFPIITYYTHLGLDLEKEPFEDLAVEWMEQYLHFSKDAALFDGVTEVLSAIKARQLPQIMVSATEKNMLIGQLTELGVIAYFDEILGLDNIHAHSKIDIAKEWAKRVQPQKAVVIGDTAHDFEVSQAIGADCILIANGHQSKETLKKLNCTVVEDIREVIERLM